MLLYKHAIKLINKAVGAPYFKTHEIGQNMGVACSLPKLVLVTVTIIDILN